MGRAQRQSDPVALLDERWAFREVRTHQEGAGTVRDLQFLRVQRSRLVLYQHESLRDSQAAGRRAYLRQVLRWIVDLLFRLVESRTTEN